MRFPWVHAISRRCAAVRGCLLAGQANLSTAMAVSLSDLRVESTLEP